MQSKIMAKVHVEIEIDKENLAHALVEQMLKELGLGTYGVSNQPNDYYVGSDGVSIYKVVKNYGPYDDPDKKIGENSKAASLLLAAYALTSNRFNAEWAKVANQPQGKS